MKTITAVVCGLITWLCISMNKGQANFSKTKQLNFTFNQDSGYISKLQADYLFRKLNIVSKKNFKKYSFHADSDTLGKYYRSDLTGNYIICILDNYTGDFETHVLIELKPKPKSLFEVVAVERYLHGNYSCCWENMHEGFRKIGNFFTIRTCGTGSGFCDSHEHIFQRVQAQEDIHSIRTNMFSWWESDTVFIFGSNLKAHQEQLEVRYEFRLDKYIKINDSTSYFETVEKTDSFSIIYQWRNEEWLPIDSTYLKKHEVLMY